MGTSIQFLSDSICLVASRHSWIEGQAVQQLHSTAKLSGMQKIAGMPDLHPGKGYPIGAACLSQGILYPALVGSDIGCGMSFWQTDLSARKAKPEKWQRQLSQVEQPLQQHWQALVIDEKQRLNIHCDEFDHALGTIGGGNHFAEFQQVDEIYDDVRAAQLGLNPQTLQLLVHSGSRGYGQRILQHHVQRFGHHGLADDSNEQQAYLQCHDEALRWAQLNRQLIAQRFLHALGTHGEPLLDVHHNLVSASPQPDVSLLDGQPSAWLHRKGATPADQGPVVIPGSRGDYSWLVEPITDTDNVRHALWSLAHGAGRKWKRTDCKGRLSHKYSQTDLRRTRLGSVVICNDKELLYEEAPQAYKDSRRVIDDLLEAGLVRLIARLKPVLTFKTQGGRC
ncbi:RNA ligase RtcB family protein [Bacterioplanes sanyensis]|uniref:3'-phosphate/5'-hydroxy nucleic acid ligase n=1 Tax=Bacterioplanes sanyensis TaxID=1249553 RepID=A0A222FGX7_9GAMM|nr:RNA ligase RtcB family protein [Bacterioplanes sanyensis]ASP37691.1 RNA ligase RtcB family protein [Bacterioplanes sanyensis]